MMTYARTQHRGGANAGAKGLKRIVKAAVSSQTAEDSPIAVLTCLMLQILRTFSTSEDH